jgi:Tol biopolymer transport system component
VSVDGSERVLVGNHGNALGPRYVHGGRLTFQVNIGPIEFTVGGGVSPSNFTLGGGNPSNLTLAVPAGSYPVSIDPGDLEQTGASCTDGSDPTNPSVGFGEDVTCTYSFQRLATLTVQLFVQPSDGTDFTFNAGGGLSPSTFQLDYVGENVEPPSQRTFTALQPGSGYSISQVSPPGWAPPHLVSCSDGSSPSNITLSYGEHVTCTFSNHPPTAGFAGFQIDSQPDGFGARFFGLTFPVDIDDNPSTSTPNLGGMWVNAGTYSMRQEFTSGWNVTSATCADGSPVWAASVQPEEVLVCTWVNQQAPTGRVVAKLVDDPAYTGVGFGFTAGGGLNGPQFPSSFSLSRSVDPEWCFPKCPADNDTKLFQVSPGSSYSLSETVPSGWELTSATCDDGSPVSNISVSSGETVTCTFTNRRFGSLKITQDTQPDDPHDFSYDVAGPDPASFVLDDDGDDGNGTASSQTLTGISAGTYSVTQAADPAWSRFYGYCSDGSPISNISISSGENVTCRFGNTAAGQPAPGTAIGAGGIKANQSSFDSMISANGSLVAFQSSATNLSADDISTAYDIYARNLRTGEVRLASRATGPTGVKGNGESTEPSVSADGRYLAFTSRATNLDPADGFGTEDVYLRDLVGSTTTLVSRASGVAGAKGNSYSFDPSISADGRYVAFTSDSTNLDPSDTDSTHDVYVRDLQASTTTLVSRATGATGAKANGQSYYPAISGNGRYVAFTTTATNLDAADTDAAITDVYVRDLQAGTTTLVSRATGAAGAKGSGSSIFPSVSGDGRYVSFQSTSGNLDPADTSTQQSIFLRDVQSSSTELVSRADGAGGATASDSAQPGGISSDGRYVTFRSFADELDPTAPGSGAFVRDRQENTTRLKSLQTGAGAAGQNSSVSTQPTTSDDGRYTAFATTASNLTPDDPVASFDVYVRDSQTNVTSLESRASPTYARAKAATPLVVPLVPAYQSCGSPNRAHAPPLTFNSCAPPALVSPHLTAGTPDANGAPANLVASVKLNSLTEPLPLNPGNGDQSDVGLDVSVADVRNSGPGLADYTGELELRLALRITDRVNFPTTGGMGPGTSQGFDVSATVPCTATGASTIGSSCTLATTLEAVAPGAVVESSRGIWQLGQLEVYDGGTDSDGDTTGDNAPFLRQGVFVP